MSERTRKAVDAANSVRVLVRREPLKYAGNVVDAREEAAKRSVTADELDALRADRDRVDKVIQVLGARGWDRASLDIWIRDRLSAR